MTDKEEMAALNRIESLLRNEIVIFDKETAERLLKLGSMNDQEIELFLKGAKIDSEERKHLNRLIEISRGWDAIGALGGFLKKVFIFVALSAAFVASLKVGLTDWLGITK